MQQIMTNTRIMFIKMLRAKAQKTVRHYLQSKCECVNIRNLIEFKIQELLPRQLNLNGRNTRNIKLINQPDKMFAPILSAYIPMFSELKIPIHLHKALIWINVK